MLATLYTQFAIRFDGDNHSVRTTEDIFLNAFSSSRPQSVFIFSENFFRENNRFDNQTENLNDASSGVALVTSLDSGETEVKTLDLQGRNIETIASAEKQSLHKSISTSIISESSFAIQGGVFFPGLYPIANKVTLSELLEVAGGLTPLANPKQISIRKYMDSLVDNEIRQLSEKRIDLTEIDPSAITLSGRFDVFVPKLQNNAAVGSVTLLGELKNPGEFVFGINDTLHDVIERAGGFSEVAYPLGAQFLRKKLVQEETKENQLLAEKVARSVLTVAQSDVLNSQSQVAAVLGYAEQLKTLSTSGRQVINVAFKDANNPILLEDGDTLIVPKRPSHVTVMGNVQRTVSAPYQSFKGIDEYIIDSGGFDELADEKNIFVQLPNGQNISGNFSTPIPPGSIIIVPPNVNKLTPLALTDIVSRVLGNIATSLLAINAVQ
jgi:protein involved in polysaccharide export with SLBB domain